MPYGSGSQKSSRTTWDAVSTNRAAEYSTASSDVRLAPHLVSRIHWPRADGGGAACNAVWPLHHHSRSGDTHVAAHHLHGVWWGGMSASCRGSTAKPLTDLLRSKLLTRQGLAPPQAGQAGKEVR